MSTDTTAPSDWLRFRERRNSSLAQAHGWLSLTGFFWLPDSPARLPGLPGLWSASDGGAELAAAEADGLRLVGSGEPVHGRLTAELNDEDSLLWVGFRPGHGGDVAVELARRAGRYLVRPRDAASEVLTSFHGVPVYGYAPEWVLPGVFEPYREPVDVPIRTAHPQVPGVQRSVGEVVFSVPGTPARQRLQVSSSGTDSLTLTFHDGTNGTSTAGWRSLTFPAPAAGTRDSGAVVLDFNRAVNYPSAFTPFGTCPMPVEGNMIPVPVEAGEMRPDTA